jgi:hypothetical protein
LISSEPFAKLLRLFPDQSLQQRGKKAGDSKCRIFHEMLPTSGILQKDADITTLARDNQQGNKMAPDHQHYFNLLPRYASHNTA